VNGKSRVTTAPRLRHSHGDGNGDGRGCVVVVVVVVTLIKKGMILYHFSFRV